MFVDSPNPDYHSPNILYIHSVFMRWQVMCSACLGMVGMSGKIDSSINETRSPLHRENMETGSKIHLSAKTKGILGIFPTHRTLYSKSDIFIGSRDQGYWYICSKISQFFWKWLLVSFVYETSSNSKICSWTGKKKEITGKMKIKFGWGPWIENSNFQHGGGRLYWFFFIVRRLEP